MGFDQQGTVVIRVVQGESGRWDVSEGEVADPLASFASREDACDYANRLTMDRAGATVVALDEGGGSDPAQGHQHSGRKQDRPQGVTMFRSST